MSAEVWKAIPGFEGLYEVSDQGRVRSLDRVVERKLRNGTVHGKRLPGRILRPAPHPFGYLVAHLWKENERHAFTIHLLVLASFVGPRPEGQDICHNSGDRQDNRLVNLRYDTRAANHADKVAHDTHSRGERNPQAKLSRADVLVLRHKRPGVPPEVLAVEFGMSADHLRKVRSGERRPYD